FDVSEVVLGTELFIRMAPTAGGLCKLPRTRRGKTVDGADPINIPAQGVILTSQKTEIGPQPDLRDVTLPEPGKRQGIPTSTCRVCPCLRDCRASERVGED
ncbi:unnamed protein product, partial [Nesidiocoris tenuis]